jgi:hypothetical protein
MCYSLRSLFSPAFRQLHIWEGDIRQHEQYTTHSCGIFSALHYFESLLLMECRIHVLPAFHFHLHSAEPTICIVIWKAITRKGWWSNVTKAFKSIYGNLRLYTDPPVFLLSGSESHCKPQNNVRIMHKLIELSPPPPHHRIAWVQHIIHEKSGTETKF